jgi:hypothetical protein
VKQVWSGGTGPVKRYRSGQAEQVRSTLQRPRNIGDSAGEVCGPKGRFVPTSASGSSRGSAGEVLGLGPSAIPSIPLLPASHEGGTVQLRLDAATHSTVMLNPFPSESAELNRMLFSENTSGRTTKIAAAGYGLPTH